MSLGIHCNLHRCFENKLSEDPTVSAPFARLCDFGRLIALGTERRSKQRSQHNICMPNITLWSVVRSVSGAHILAGEKMRRMPQNATCKAELDIRICDYGYNYMYLRGLC